MTPRDAIAFLPRLRSDILAEATKLVDETIKAGKSRAIKMSSGPLKAAKLAELDHPYARRHGPEGNPSLFPDNNPAIINVQTGAFRAAWQVKSASQLPKSIEATLRNDDVAADDLVEGTMWAISRPIIQSLELFMKTEVAKNTSKTLLRLYKKYGN